LRSVFLEAGAFVAVAVMVLVAITTLALRRSASPRRAVARRGGSGGSGGVSRVLAALPTWGGVLVTVLLAARGKLALAAIALVATVVHVGIGRARASVALRRE
jgi:hypothetical protein